MPVPRSSAGIVEARERYGTNGASSRCAVCRFVCQGAKTGLSALVISGLFLVSASASGDKAQQFSRYAVLPRQGIFDSFVELHTSRCDFCPSGALAAMSSEVV